MPRHRSSVDFTTEEKAHLHDQLMPLLEAMQEEFQELSKRKPDAVLSKRKVEIVNRLLQTIVTVVEGEITRNYLDLLDDENLPVNSDVALILGQAAAAMIAFKEKYHGFIESLGRNTWAVKG